MARPKLRSGYAYVLDGKPSEWRTAADERWGIDTISQGEADKGRFAGIRTIDGESCAVFRMKWADKPTVAIAQSRTYTG